MKHVRALLDGGGREAEIHPVYDVLINASYVDRATAMQWSFSGDELGILHYVEGDRERFADAMESIPAVLAYELTAADSGSFYAYIRDETTEPMRELLDSVTGKPVVVIPPAEFTDDGTVAYSMVGPPAEIQSALEEIPDPIGVTVTEISGLSSNSERIPS